MEKNGGSRLLQMQARFQQKQMQERELKIASLYEAQQARALDRVRHSPSNGAGPTPPHPHQPPAHQPGKVRQMFEERRTKAGIDKSYPLQPIQNTERTPPRKTLPNGYTKVSSTTKNSVEKKTVKTTMISSSHSVKKQNITTQKINNHVVNGSGDLNHNHELDIIEPKIMHVNGEIIPTAEEKDDVDNGNNDMIENETFPEALAPAPTPRSPQPAVEVIRPQRRSPAATQRPKSPIKSKPAPATSPPRRVASENRVPSRENSKPKGAMQRGQVLRNIPATNSQPSSGSNKTRSAPANSAALPEGACSVCGRHFAPDRLPKHQEICRKTHTKKRKPFDVLKHRLAGTEAEPFISKLRKGTTSSTKVPQKNLNNNWRQKHEEFIQAIRAAKQVQAHLDAGGKLSDLPPPPPSENPDYVQCPHCKRRFNQAAAERHIPKCASFQFNKSKQPAKRR
ncbi:zinc finger C2HC domain-containing protein 1C isoform X2 [Bicyclus anynana]|uniref:Zinc finger C2HC domain-containing protein 1C isoform X2 n=1 Tax=Bicyclus anynana TaxID=110368 RepID=A0ABM3LYD1_BICAN|nr:zinc finger C2HC domain-containing protein 1C isoform X2 [Bicyclus anynana]